MTDSEPKAPVCGHCGALLAPGALQGLCPRCLMALNFATPTGLSEAGEQSALPSPAGLALHFPQLEILECLGRGGMGIVYRARQKSLNRLVALKLLAPGKGRAAHFPERFSREALLLARLNHPNIVAVYDFGEADGLYYLLMEFVDGLSLRQLLRSGQITPEQALGIVPKICEALQYAHEHGVVHRDIKPENVLVDKDGHVKIADFGIAKLVGREATQPALTQDQQVIGTPHYMAPEQVEHPHQVDHRADIYSLGVVFYEMLTGELPLGKFPPPSKRASVDDRLDEVVLNALEKEPDCRYQHASEVKRDVETIATTPHPAPAAAVTNAPVTSHSRALKRAREHPRLAAAAILLAGLGLAGTLSWLTQPPTPPAAVADTTPPSVLRAQFPGGPDTLLVTFSEPLAPASAEQPRNYTIAGMHPKTATLEASGTNVVLRLAESLPAGTTNTLTIDRLQDRAPVPNIMPVTQVPVRAPVLVRGCLRADYYLGIRWHRVDTLTTDPRFPDHYDRTLYQTNSTAITGYGDNYGLRLWGFFIPPTNGNYTFYVRSDDESEVYLSTDDRAENKRLVASQIGASRAYDDNNGRPRFSTVKGLLAGQMYFLEILFKEAEAEDYLTLVYKAEGEPPPIHKTPSVTPIPGSCLACYAGTPGLPAQQLESPVAQHRSSP